MCAFNLFTMLLYSSDAPAGWNALSTPIKQKFHDIGQKGDWTAQEAYDHLVPDHLKDNPDEVQAWMDGDPSLGINDKDVSRIESGENGGEYSTDNTVMEDMSVNRSRGADNMTEAELDMTVQQNASDAELIENAYSSVEEPFDMTLQAASSEGAADIFGDLLGFTSEVVSNVLPPIIIAKEAMKESTEDAKWIAGGGTLAVCTALMFTPAAPIVGLSALGISVWNIGDAISNKMSKTTA